MRLDKSLLCTQFSGKMPSVLTNCPNYSTLDKQNIHLPTASLLVLREPGIQGMRVWCVE